MNRRPLLVKMLLAFFISFSTYSSEDFSFLSELEVKQTSKSLEKDLFRNKTDFFIDNFIPGSSVDSEGNVFQFIVSPESIKSKIMERYPDAKFEYDQAGRLIIDPKEHGLIRFHSGFQFGESKDNIDNLPLNVDNHTLFVGGGDVLVKDLVIKAGPTIAETLKISGGYNIVVDNVKLIGGREDAFDIVRGNNIYFRNVEFMSANGGRGATIKGGVSNVYISKSKFTGNPNVDCIPDIREKVNLWLFKLNLSLFNETCHHVEIGNFGSYSIFDEIKVPEEDLTAAKKYVEDGKTNFGQQRFHSDYLNFIYYYNKANAKNSESLFFPKRPKTRNIYIDAEFENAKRNTHKGGKYFPVQFWSPLTDANSVYAFDSFVQNINRIRAKKILWHEEQIGDNIEEEWKKQTYDVQIDKLKVTELDKIRVNPDLIYDLEKEKYKLKKGRWNNHSFWGPVYYDGENTICVPYKKLSWLYLDSEDVNLTSQKALERSEIESLDYDSLLTIWRADQLEAFRFAKESEQINDSIVNSLVYSTSSIDEFIEFLDAGFIDQEFKCPLNNGAEVVLADAKNIRQLVDVKVEELNAKNIAAEIEHKRRLEEEKKRLENEEKEDESASNDENLGPLTLIKKISFRDGDDVAVLIISGNFTEEKKEDLVLITINGDSDLIFEKDEVQKHGLSMEAGWDIKVNNLDKNVTVKNDLGQTVLTFELLENE